MPTLPTSVAESMQGLRLAAEQAARMLKARPALLVLAGITWGIQLVSEYDTAFAFVTTLMKLVFSAAFFGVVAEIAAARGSGITWKLVGSSIRSLTIGTVVITTAYTLPVLIGAPFLNLALGSRLEGIRWSLVVLVGITVVPSIAAIWSLAYWRSSLVEAVLDGIQLMKGRWAVALAAGIAYQAAALAGQLLRMFLLASLGISAGLALAGLIMLAWVLLEAVFRVTLLYWLFDDVPRPFEPEAAA